MFTGTRTLPATGGERLADLTPLAEEIIEIAVGDLRLYFPRVREANLVKAHVVKEQRATFAAAPETESLRPGPASKIANLYIAGDWTRTNWPATMEGAVRSGYIAAEALSQSIGKSVHYLLADRA
jgi:zeta-carotene desaturase